MRGWLVRIAIALAVLVAVLATGAELLLHSGFATTKVADQLQALAGAPVHVGSVDVGIANSSLHDLQFFEDGASPGLPPWAEIPAVDADLSLVRLIRSDFAGGDITLHRAKLILRLDRDERLLTRFPPFSGPSHAWPVVHVDDAHITFQRVGSPDTVFDHITGTLQKDGDRITLRGAANDSDWGTWTIAGDRADANASFNLTLHTDVVRASPEKLKRVPFVPPVTWEQLSLDGETPVDLTLQFGESVHYRVALAPKDLMVHVAAIDLTTRGTTGKAVIADGVVTLTDVKGSAAGGSLHLTTAVLDFRGDGSEQRYAISGDRLLLRELPARWGLPAWAGRLSGQADMKISTAGGRVRTSGSGKGAIAGFLAKEIDVKLAANDSGFKFDISNPPGARLAPTGGPTWTAADALVTLLAAGLVTVQPPAAEPEQTIRINLGLTDVSIAELVKKLNLTLPIRLDGKVTFHVQATMPLSDAKDLKRYHAVGTVEFPWVRIADAWLQQVKARVTLENGVLRLEELSAREPNPPPTAPPTELLPGGTLSGTASVSVAPVGDVSGNLKLAALPIGPLLRLIPGANVKGVGTVDGEAQFHAPAGALTDLRKWEGSGKFTGRDLQVQGIPADRFTATVGLRGGIGEYAFKGEALGGTFDINGRYPSPPDAKPGEQGRIDLHGIDLARLADTFRANSLKPLAGRLDFNADIASFDNPSGDGQLTLTEVAWGGKPLTDRIHGTVRAADGIIRSDDLTGRLAGGSVRVRVLYDYARSERSNVSLTAERVDGRTLLAPFSESPPLEGPVDIRLFSRLGPEIGGTGQVLMGAGKLFGLTVRDAQFPLGWTVAPGRRGEIRLHDASAQASRGRLTGQADLAWGDAVRLDGQVQFNGVDVGELLTHYTQSRVVGGLASGRVDLAGRNMQSAKDLSARVQAKLVQTAPAQIPVFRQIMPMLLPGMGSNVQFQSGDLRGRLASGIFRIERLTLIGDLARIYAEGTVTLQQRLNLDVVANTNQLGVDPAFLQLLGLALPAVGPIPLGTLNQAVSYLSNRTLSLRVTGTIKSPSIQPNVTPFLTESVVRFFVAQAGVPIPSTTLQAPAP